MVVLPGKVRCVGRRRTFPCPRFQEKVVKSGSVLYWKSVKGYFMVKLETYARIARYYDCTFYTVQVRQKKTKNIFVKPARVGARL